MVLDSVIRFMNVIIQAAAAMVKRAVLMILPALFSGTTLNGVI